MTTTIRAREHLSTTHAGGVDVHLEAVELPARGRAFEVRFSWTGYVESPDGDSGSCVVHEHYHANSLELGRAVAAGCAEQLQRWPGRCPDPRAIAKALKERRHVAAGHKRLADGAVLLDTPRDELPGA